MPASSPRQNELVRRQELRQRIWRLRRRIDRRADRLVDQALMVGSWRRYVRRHPGRSLLAAVGVGILAAQLTSHRQWLDRYAGQLYHLATSATWEWIWRHLRQFVEQAQVPAESAAAEEDDA